jgi:NAD(P)H-hydrate epimerase
MLPVFTAEAMRALDRRATTELGIPGAVLMEHAGQGAAAAMTERFPVLGSARRPVVILCGKGGNGGDGFVVARHLGQRGVHVRVLLAVPEHEIAGDAAAKLDALKAAGMRPVPVPGDDVLSTVLAEAEIVVDALLGTGGRGAPDTRMAVLIERINASGRPVVALDVPSGLPAGGEAPPGPVVRAALTTTFAGLKRGLVTGPSAGHAGRIVVVPIGVPDAEVRRGVNVWLLERADVAPLFPPRARESHKGDYGRLLIVAGSAGKTGAAALAADAAMRTGAGLVTVATAASQQAVVATMLLESMTEAVPETAARSIGLAGLPLLEELGHARDAVAIGPGIGLAEETGEVVRRLVRDLRVPAVVDADALTALARDPRVLRDAAAARCLTPHPGEMARLAGLGADEVQRDRIEIARSFAAAHGVELVLKGATTIIASPTGTVLLNPTGNPGMASGGTGDVLTGMIGALLARGFAPDRAAYASVFLHGAAGDAAASRVGEESLIARDVIEALPRAFTRLRESADPDSAEVTVLA